MARVRLRRSSGQDKPMAKILYHAVPVPWRKEEKYAFLEETGSPARVTWQQLSPDDKGNWITSDTDEEYDSFLPLGSKEAKAGTSVPTICANVR